MQTALGFLAGLSVWPIAFLALIFWGRIEQRLYTQRINAHWEKYWAKVNSDPNYSRWRQEGKPQPYHSLNVDYEVGEK